MSNKAIEILKKAEHDLDIEIRMWQKQGRPEVAARCKIEKEQVKQAIEKLSTDEKSEDKIKYFINYLPTDEEIKQVAIKYRPQQDQLGEFWRDGFRECYLWLSGFIKANKS